MLRDIDKTVSYLDDVLIYGIDEQDCFETVTEVLTKFRDYNVKVRWEKSQFFERSISYLGHEISAEGIKVSPKKLERILNCPPPVNTTQFKSFLGIVRSYHRHIPNLSAKIPSLFRLLKKM